MATLRKGDKASTVAIDSLFSEFRTPFRSIHRKYSIVHQFRKYKLLRAKCTANLRAHTHTILAWNPRRRQSMLDLQVASLRRGNMAKVLNCPGCFAPVCYSCELHEEYDQSGPAESFLDAADFRLRSHSPYPSKHSCKSRKN